MLDTRIQFRIAIVTGIERAHRRRQGSFRPVDADRIRDHHQHGRTYCGVTPQLNRRVFRRQTRQSPAPDGGVSS